MLRVNSENVMRFLLVAFVAMFLTGCDEPQPEESLVLDDDIDDDSGMLRAEEGSIDALVVMKATPLSTEFERKY